MPKFIYTVQDAQGNASTGILDASDEEQAVLTLQGKDLFILSIQQEAESSGVIPRSKSRTRGKISGRDMCFFSEQLATLLAGGVPLVRALSLLGEHNSNRALSYLLSNITKEVAAGGTFNKAIEKYPDVFDTIWVSLIQAGEMSGQLPGALRQISNYVNTQETLKGKIITAVAYPAVLCFMSVGVLVYFVIFIVPTFAKIFKDFNLRLPPLTQFIVFVSGLFTHYYVLLIGIVVAAFFGFKGYIKTEAGNIAWTNMKMDMPILGQLIRSMQMERLLSTMGTLIKSGVSILNTITVLERAFEDNVVIQRALKTAKNEVAAGKSISLAFKNTGVFPGLVTEMMWMGEESGKLPDIINVLSAFYQDQINQWIARFSSLIDPILVVGVGGIIGVIVLSIFLPIFKLSEIGNAN